MSASSKARAMHQTQTHLLEQVLLHPLIQPPKAFDPPSRPWQPWPRPALLTVQGKNEPSALELRLIDEGDAGYSGRLPRLRNMSRENGSIRTVRPPRTPPFSTGGHSCGPRREVSNEVEYPHLDLGIITNPRSRSADGTALTLRATRHVEVLIKVRPAARDSNRIGLE